MKKLAACEAMILRYGADILESSNMQMEKMFMQHGNVSVFEHSVFVACVCLLIAGYLHIRVNHRALVRGALLHDYFLYDWHVPDKSHRLHGFHHARKACENASRDFDLGEIEKDAIRKHMFPLNLRPPKYRESVIVCLADKICATGETLRMPYCRNVRETLGILQGAAGQNRLAK